MKRFALLLLPLTWIMVGTSAHANQAMVIAETKTFVARYNTIGQGLTPKLPKITLNNTQKTETKQITTGVTMHLTKANIGGYLGQLDIKCVNLKTGKAVDMCIGSATAATIAVNKDIEPYEMEQVFEMAMQDGYAQYLNNNIEYNAVFDADEKHILFNIQPRIIF